MRGDFNIRADLDRCKPTNSCLWNLSVADKHVDTKTRHVCSAVPFQKRVPSHGDFRRNILIATTNVAHEAAGLSTSGNRPSYFVGNTISVTSVHPNECVETKVHRCTSQFNISIFQQYFAQCYILVSETIMRVIIVKTYKHSTDASSQAEDFPTLFIERSIYGASQSRYSIGVSSPRYPVRRVLRCK